MVTSVGLEVMLEPRLRINTGFPGEKPEGEGTLAFQREEMHMPRFQELDVFWKPVWLCVFSLGEGPRGKWRKMRRGGVNLC